MTVEQAIEELTRFRLLHERRDDLIRAAHAAGLTPTQIIYFSGAGRNTVYRALAARGTDAR